MKMTYTQFEDVLQYDYNPKDIRHLFNMVKGMNSRGRLRVIKWVLFGHLPTEAIEGVTAEELINTMGFKPMNAFIILDWLETAPDEAKFFLLKPHPDQTPSEDIVQEMQEFLQAQNMQPQSEPACQPTDTITENEVQSEDGTQQPVQ